MNNLKDKRWWRGGVEVGCKSADTLELARIFHESSAATADVAALLSELEALRAGGRASSGVPSTGSGQAHLAT
jgi:hypothetical protein